MTYRLDTIRSATLSKLKHIYECPHEYTHADLRVLHASARNNINRPDAAPEDYRILSAFRCARDFIESRENIEGWIDEITEK